ncbi:MAG: TetR/AcrR family transcriptional regulator [Anaerolineae bacterium]
MCQGLGIANTLVPPDLDPDTWTLYNQTYIRLFFERSFVARKPADQSVNRDDIIIAAADVLRRNGYEATTMKDIAAEVNLTAASLYHHFRNKDFLVLAVLEGGLQHVIEKLEPIVESDQTNARKLAQMIEVHVISVTENTAVGAAMVFEIRSLMNTPSIQSALYDDFVAKRNDFFRQRDDFENLYRRVIRAGIAAGEFREVDADIYTKMMLGAHNWVAVWYRPGRRLNGQAIAHMMADYILHGLKP